MFTGIIEEIGKIQNITKSKDGYELKIGCQKILDDIKIGDSIAVNGICLTVTKYDKNSFCVDVMNETLNKTSLKGNQKNHFVNLERALKIGSRFGGHIVSGHIDGIGTIINFKNDGIAKIVSIKTKEYILKYIIKKGSITIDGISLTVIDVNQDWFNVSIIPHTFSSTILQYKKNGDIVNLENDCIGKYIEKLIENNNIKKDNKNNKWEDLLKNF